MDVFTIPNAITYLRIFLIFILVLFFVVDDPSLEPLHLLFFTIAAATDYLDGYIARLWSMQSNLGKILDPIADKLLVSTMLLLLASDGIVVGYSLIPASIIICREIIISNFRAVLAESDLALNVSYSAKYKTALQFIAIFFLISGDYGNSFFIYSHDLGIIALWLSAVFTFYSAVIYLYNNSNKIIG